MKNYFFLFKVFAVYIFANCLLWAQQNSDNVKYYQSFIREKNIENLPKIFSDLYKNPNDSITQLCFNHVQKLKNNVDNNTCNKVYLTITEAKILQYQNKFSAAINLYELILKELQKTNCKGIKMQDLYRDLGTNYNYIGKNVKALDAFYKALKFALKDKDTLAMCKANYEIGNLYIALNKKDKAKKSYEKSIQLAGNNPKFNTQKIDSYLGLGNVEQPTIESINNAIINFNKLIKIFKEDKNFYELNYIYNDLGIAYSLKGDNKTAFIYYKKALDYATANKNYMLLGNVTLDYAYSYSDLNQIENAIYYAEQSYKSYKKIGLLDAMVDANDLLSQFYIKNKNFEKAYKHQSLFIKHKDSLYAASNAEKLVELKKDYEFGIEREQLNNEVLNYKLRNTILIASLVFFALLFGLFYLVIKRKNLKKEAQFQEQYTFQLLQNTEEERGRIANELHDSVNHDLLNIKNKITNGKKIEVEDVSHVIEEVRNISRNLHPAVLETLGLEASIENLCERLTEIGLFTTCEIDYRYKLNKNKELQLYRIVQEALNNTLKHGKAKAAKVSITSLDNYLNIEIKDNGSGFNVNEQLTNPKSFGLQSILQRAKAIMAKINIDSNINGTIILIKIPV